ncbi:MAG: alpha-mannosidase [Nitrososphaerales archaeon]
MTKRYHATVVSHTHWDRAWYVTFQEFRIRLVRLVDRLLDLLESRPDYRCYMLDGQMAVLEDYLEVRPQRAAEIQQLCRSGRLQVGPWYVLADEFLVSPEALIRNMMLGHRIGEDYGGVSKLGYVPDGFGHMAQLPQILRGFNIDNAFFWRGVGAEGDRLGTEFVWCAPDGSQVTAILMPWGYHNISNIGYAIHWGDTSQMEFSEELALAQIRKAVDALKPMAHTPALLLMNGIDHAEPEPRIPEIVALANREFDDVQFSHGTLADHLAAVRAAGVALPEFSGEFRWGRYSEILQGVYATRIHLKQINHRVETLLERYVEPLTALAWLAGADLPAGTQDLVWTAWRWLLKNHPHDDIYGSGIDTVHQEMLYRFDQAEQIGDALVRDSLRLIARQADFTAQEGTPVLVYNPLGWLRQETVTGHIDFDFDDPKAADFELVDAQGCLVPHQVLGDEQVFWMETLKPSRKRRVEVAFRADVPALGYATYYARDRSSAGAPALPAAGVWQVRPDGAENGCFAFSITPDGGIDVLDKATNEVYRGLGHLYDVEDAGDEYSYCPAAHGEAITTAGGVAHIRLAHEGPSAATYRVERTLSLPAGLTEDRSRRSSERVTMPVTTEVTIYRDRPLLSFRTEIDNTVRDHKISVVFPTGVHAQSAYVDESFAVLERPLDLPDSTGWVEDPTPLMHQRTFTDVCGSGRGLAVLNRGLPAVEVTRDPDGAVISLTLLRSVGWLSRDDLSNRRVAAGPLVPTPGAQCLGSHCYEYALLPHGGDWREVYPVAYGYVAPLLVARGDTHEGLDLREMNITRDDPAQVRAIPWPHGGSWPGRASFVSVEPAQMVLSAVRRSAGGEGLVVRFYNVDRTPAVARITAGFDLKAAHRMNLDEQVTEPLAVRDGRVVEAPVRGAEVVTIELLPDRDS